MDEVREVIADAKAEELERNCVPPDSPGQLIIRRSLVRVQPAPR
jgi:hypothetical protein